MLAVVALVAVVLAVVALWSSNRSKRIQEARELLPRITTLTTDLQVLDAHALAREVEGVLGEDPEFQAALHRLEVPISVVTEPEGATVFAKPYETPDASWERVGETPIEDCRLPFVNLRWKVELEGYEILEEVRTPGTLEPVSGIPATTTLEWTLVERGSAHESMVLVPKRGERPEFWIDKYEVSNRRYKAFVDAGGYRNPDYWKHEFVSESGSFEAAMRLFVDRTGLPGPSTWEGGEYPAGEGDFPVHGVSWYEAAAFAEFDGKSLPTLEHWGEATGNFIDWTHFQFSRLLLPIANFSSSGPRAVGASEALTPLGAHDMAGNVRNGAGTSRWPGEACGAEPGTTRGTCTGT